MKRDEDLLETRKKQGQRIAAARGLTLLSSREFEELTGFSRATIYHLETKYETGITETTFKKLVKAFQKAGLEISEDWLRDGVFPHPYNRNLINKDMLIEALKEQLNRLEKI